MEEKILNYLRACFEEQNFNHMNAVRCARALNASRVDVSAALSRLLTQKKVLRITTRPYLFIPVFLLQEKGLELEIRDYVSLKDLEESLRPSQENQEEADPFDRLVGSHHSLKPMISQMKAAISYPPAGLPVLLKGPTGTGKSQMAALAYEWARKEGLLQKKEQFVQLNCSEYANNPELLNASLFGYVKGAFTGADKDTSGLAALADGGILFLDEVHNLSPQSQEKLFHLMDQGIYHQMGDNENTLYSRCRMIFATTEDPDQVLLRTLIRRIPIVIEVPSLKERGKRERIALIAGLLEQEQKRLQKPIYLSGGAYELLLNAEIPGNIGELKSVIQFGCVNALFEADPEVRIQLRHIPIRLFGQTNRAEQRSQPVMEFYTVDQLLHFYDEDKKTVQISEQLLDTWLSVPENNKSTSLILQMRLMLMRHLDERAEEAREDSQSYYWMGLSQAFSLFCHEDVQSPERLRALSLLLQEISFHEAEYQNWSLVHEEDCQDLLAFVQEHYYKTFRTTQQICLFLQSAVELNTYPMIIVLLFLCLLDPLQQDTFRGRAALIAAHGFSTASSMAEAANQLLGSTVFDAIDMPVTSSIDQVIEKVRLYTSRFSRLEELILLVDMGSLETILDGLQDLECSIGLIDHVSTPAALEIGLLMEQRHSLEDILEQTCQASGSHYRIRRSALRRPAIVCCCASGIGTAQHLETLLQESLPAAAQIRIVSVSYPSLLQEKESSSVFREWDVLCLVGTLDPGLKEVPFISVEDLVTGDHFARLEMRLEPLLTLEQSRQFQENLLRNFSLYNLMSELTILNPQKLLEQITPCVEELQRELGMTLSSATCIGLYIHISCMIERICFSRVSQEGMQPEGTPSSPDLLWFTRLCQEVFRPLENRYRLQIPQAEIAYLYEYIRHDAAGASHETADF